MAQESIIGVIPARWKSSRFPGKPLVNLLGKSLIQRTYENAKKSTLLNNLVIATDDIRIFDHVSQFGAPVFLTSEECATGTERVCEVIANYFPNANIILNIQGDEPCINPTTLDLLILKMQESKDIVVTTPVTPILDETHICSPSVVKCVFDHRGQALYFSRQPIPFKRHHEGKYWRHIGVYCFQKEFLLSYPHLSNTPLQLSEDLEQLKILEHGFPLHVCMVDKEEGIGVDTPEDLKKIEQLLCLENIFL